MTLYQHFIELRFRATLALLAFIAAASFAYLYSQTFYEVLTRPLLDAYGTNQERKLIFTGLTEAFFVNIKIACFTGFLLAFPVISYQLYRFVAPGLYQLERKMFISYIIMSPILFALGAALVYFYVMPLAWKFFISFEQLGGSSHLPVKLEARISEYLALVMSLILGFGLAFQLPLILILLCKLGMVSGNWLGQMRRYCIVIIFIIAAILTPPDVISQIALALPLLLLYEISVLICKRIDKVKNDNA
jgi:sec-independent protein translocase protein TatC